MKHFMDENFLLSTPTACRLYRDYAAKMPIIDYHCHLSAKEIAQNKRFETVTRLWLGEDHYKWRLMRSFGVEERYITGNATDKEKFKKWVETLAFAAGNPLYHWSHLELKNYFDIHQAITPQQSEALWQQCNEKLSEESFSAQELILRSGVEVICTTDDPADSLEWHRELKESGFPVKVLPSFRPDKALAIEKENYLEYLSCLGDIHDFASLKKALEERLDFFVSLGCRVSDHGMEAVPFSPADEKTLESIFAARLNGNIPEKNACDQYKTALLLFLAKAYQKRGIVMQLHFGVMRDLNERIYSALGPDAGIDAIADHASLKDLAAFLNALEKESALPKTVLYSLNPGDNAALVSIIGAFQSAEAKGKIQHGSAWWFNDHKKGMTQQLETLAAEGHLAAFIGMLTDSRSFLSYARHEYFRRILCDIIGTWVENGEFCADEAILKTLIENICYYNAKRYFGF